MHKLKISLATAALAILMPLAHAGGGGGGSIVFDPTNYAKNTITAAQTAQQVSEQVRSNMLLLQQYQEMYRLGKAASSTVLGAGKTIVGADSVNSNISSLSSLKSLLGGLQGSLSNLDSRQRYIGNLAQRSGLSTQTYIDRVVAAREAGDVQAAAQLNENMRVMQDVNDSYAAVQQWEAQNSIQTSELASIQTLNQQMSGLVKMNARALEYQAKSSTDQIDIARQKEAQELINAQKVKEKTDQLDATTRQSQQKFREALKR